MPDTMVPIPVFELLTVDKAKLKKLSDDEYLARRDLIATTLRIGVEQLDFAFLFNQATRLRRTVL